MVSRSEGYLRGAGKEELALAAAKDFFQQIVGVALADITDQNENYELGDLRSPAGITMECKGQEIDPDRYPQNFIEVFETTQADRHAGGFEEVARLLGMSGDDLAQVRVRRRGRPDTPLGRPPFISVSIHSMFNSALTSYVNYLDGGRWIYVYDRAELTGHLKRAVPRGLGRGVGKSNEDTFSVFAPVSDKRWRRTGGQWRWAGVREEGPAIAHLRGVLDGTISPL